MTLLDILDAGLCLLGVLILFTVWKKFIHRPRVWVLEDSDSDLMMFQHKMKLEPYDVRYFRSAESIINEHIKSILTFSAPTCVVIDYYLSDKIKGDEVLKYFRKNGVKSVIVTGYEGKISNIAERDIIHKSADDSYFNKVQDWLSIATGHTCKKSF